MQYFGKFLALRPRLPGALPLEPDRELQSLLQPPTGAHSEPLPLNTSRTKIQEQLICVSSLPEIQLYL